MSTADWIRELIKEGQLWRFYKSKSWLKLKAAILKESHHECAECKRRGIVTRYDIDAEGHKRLLSTVHHVRHVRDFPELALSRYYIDAATGERHDNLIPVCKSCHNVLHPEKLSNTRSDKFTTPERW